MTAEAVTKPSVAATHHSSTKNRVEFVSGSRDVSNLDSSNNMSSDHDRAAGSFLHAKWKAAFDRENMEVVDQESAGSSEDMESPRSVVVRKWPAAYVHSQVLRIRGEDSLIGEDVAENHKDCRYNKVDHDHVLILSHTPIPRPASPLSRSN